MSESVAAQLRRRRLASYRYPPMACSPCRDPHGCRCHSPDEITERYVDGYQAAAQHLMAHGMVPAPNVDAMRVMWRLGGDDQRLAVRLADYWEVAA